MLGEIPLEVRRLPVRPRLVTAMVRVRIVRVRTVSGREALPRCGRVVVRHVRDAARVRRRTETSLREQERTHVEHDHDKHLLRPCLRQRFLTGDAKYHLPTPVQKQRKTAF